MFCSTHRNVDGGKPDFGDGDMLKTMFFLKPMDSSIERTLCNNSEILDELIKWSARRDNGNPRCTEDLLENEFADFISGLAEEHQLDRSMQAFVGTIEERAEAGAVAGRYGAVVQTRED